jgi:hypothetical protein
VLLSLSVFEKRTQKTPPAEISLAESRLGAWRARGSTKRKAAASDKSAEELVSNSARSIAWEP